MHDNDGDDAVIEEPGASTAPEDEHAIDPDPTSVASAAKDHPAAPRYSRRLSDKILISFHQACDQADYDVARRLLEVFEFMLTRREMPADMNRRRNLESLVAAHERLWHLCHPDHD